MTREYRTSWAQCGGRPPVTACVSIPSQRDARESSPLFIRLRSLDVTSGWVSFVTPPVRAPFLFSFSSLQHLASLPMSYRNNARSVVFVRRRFERVSRGLVKAPFQPRPWPSIPAFSTTRKALMVFLVPVVNLELPLSLWDIFRDLGVLVFRFVFAIIL